MDSPAALAEFQRRYYLWAVGDFQREIESGFPFLSKFKTGHAWHVTQMMSNMRKHDQLFLGAALVKRFHKEAVEALGLSMNTEESRLCCQYLERARTPNPTELELDRRRKAGERGVYASRGKLTKLLKHSFDAAGMRVFEGGKTDGVLSYIDTVGTWQLITRIHTRSRHAQLSYEHSIWSVDRVKEVPFENGRRELWPVQLHSWISLAGWLGISSCTEWSGLVEEDCLQAVQDLLAVCNHFLEAAPELLEGLSV